MSLRWGCPVVRVARLSEAAEIAALHVRACTEPGAPSLVQRLELWHHVLGGGARRTQVWVALDEAGRILGFASAGAARVLRTQFAGELTALYVEPEFQRRGVGHALLRQVWAWFAQNQWGSAMAWVPRDGSVLPYLLEWGGEVLPGKKLAVVWSEIKLPSENP